MCSDQKHHHRLNQVVLGLFLPHGGLDEHQLPHEQPIFMCNTNITNVHTHKVSWNGDLISATLVHGYHFHGYIPNLDLRFVRVNMKKVVSFVLKKKEKKN